MRFSCLLLTVALICIAGSVLAVTVEKDGDGNSARRDIEDGVNPKQRALILDDINVDQLEAALRETARLGRGLFEDVTSIVVDGIRSGVEDDQKKSQEEEQKMSNHDSRILQELEEAWRSRKPQRYIITETQIDKIFVAQWGVVKEISKLADALAKITTEVMQSKLEQKQD